MISGQNGSQTSPTGSPADPSLLRRSPWTWWRDQMPITAKWAYFDHAAVAPISAPAAQAMRKFADQAAQQGDTVWPSWASQIGQLRAQFGSLLNCDADQISVVPNTTTGINLVAEGWPWQPGDNVVIPEGEFPSNLFPWLHQASRGLEVRVVPRRDGEVRVEDLIARVDDATRLISVSWVGYASGYRIDLDALVEQAHQRGVLVFLDAIQGLGMYHLDLEKTPVDFLAADGHKWLLGPEGAGIAMIRPEHLDRIRATNVGWSSVKASHDYAHPKLELRNDAARFEGGSANMVGVASLSASVDLFVQIYREHGVHAIEQRVIELAECLNDQLLPLGAATRLPKSRSHRSGIVTFTLDSASPAEFRKRAMEQGVVVSCRDGGIRASIHAYNDAHDLDRLVEVVRSFQSA